MRRQRILSILSACALPLLATVCGEPGTPPAASRAPVVTVPPPQLAITDSRDDGGVAHFYFLEPVDRRPKGQKLGPADRSLEGNLALEICRWLGDHCAQPLLARYTRTTGVGKERLQLDDDDDYYKVRWYTSKFPSVESGQTYRLTVRAAGIALGSADVMIVRRNRDLKKVDKDDFVGLRDDEGLTIRFYIERCGVFVLPATGGGATPCASGSILATANESVGVIVPAGASNANARFTIMPMTGAPGDASMVGGPFAFTPSGVNFAPPVRLSMAFASAALPSGVQENTLAAYELRDGVWRAAGAATIDAAHDRLELDVAHFSAYAVLAPVASVALSVPTSPLTVGGTGNATAIVKDAANRVLEHRLLEWSVFPSGILSVDATGKLTALGAGEATVTVTSEGQRAAASVTVGSAKAASVVIGGGSDAPLFVGATRQLSATAFDANGTAMAGRPVVWSSSDDAVASVDATGLVLAKAPGSVTITATIDGASASSAVAVRPVPVTSVTVTSTAVGPMDVGATRQLSASMFNGTTQLFGRTATWSSSDAGVASVDANGLVTAKAKGQATISATSEGVVGSIDVAVQLPAITSVIVTPASSTILVGATQQLAAAAMAGSVLQDGRGTTWKSSDDAIATVDGNGLVTAKAPGDVTISATVEGVAGSATVSVKPLPVTSVVVTAASTGPLDIGTTRQLSAGVFNGSTPLAGRPLTWSSSNTDALSVDATGLVTAKAAGNATITATAEGVSGSIDLVAQLPVITSVTVTPSAATIETGATQQLTAAAMAGSVAQSGRATSWHSSDETVATTDANGLVTGRAAGVATISATVDGVSGSSTITVVLPRITSVDVTPSSATILVGGIQQLTAVAMAGSAAQPGRTPTWTSSNESVATVDANGLVTARAAGVATISAMVDGVSGSSSITVNPVVAPVTSVVVSSTVLGPLDVGSTRQLTAAAYNGATQLFGRSVSWSSSDPNTMTVDANGLVTAVRGGSATITALVEGVSGTIGISTRGLMFGPYHIDQSLFATPFTGALRELKPTDGLAMLEAARRAGFRLIITPVSGRSRFKDPVTGRFRLDLWKLQLDRFVGMDFSSYIRDGTIIGIYLIDEPMDPGNWVNKDACMTDGNTPTCLLDSNGAIIPDAGAPVSYADIDAAAAYAQRYFPGVPMGVGSRPSQLEPGAPFQNLNFGLAQYTTNKKDSQGTTLSPTQFVAYEVAAAKRAGLAVQLSINVIAGNSGAPLLASQLRSWGTMMANEPYACALTMWKWDVVNGTGGEPYNTYWTDPTNLAALRDVAAAAASRAPVACRAR